MAAQLLPKAFIWRRLHSLTGLWLVGFLILHLVTNSQAALFIGEDGSGFIRAVNSINDLPYITIVELGLIALPFVVHMYWGVIYLRTGMMNSFSTDGSKPALPEYPRNQAYSWQRITSWILLVLIIAHVIHMRFYERPAEAHHKATKVFMMPVSNEPGIYPVSERLGVTLYTPEQVDQEIETLQKRLPPLSSQYSAEALLKNQEHERIEEQIDALKEYPLQKDQLLALSPTFGTSELLMLREAFKSPLMIVLYSMLVISACFHAFNGLWTFMITWGATLSARSQGRMLYFAYSLMCVIAFLGLAAVWGTYWINLTQ